MAQESITGIKNQRITIAAVGNPTSDTVIIEMGDEWGKCNLANLLLDGLKVVSGSGGFGMCG
ncbi:12471_t:CDS:2 [Ambispora gerdemannii]|uniref:12471_t:CDS:1 n=1 Tax=Ambispora gerdemannii TaxID=144530 RepID=A0A9N9B2E4_9GLOM|nr:12471_t:CDS:2 [Ambispora gerdemannii]